MFIPLKYAPEWGDPERKKIGLQAIENGCVAAIVLAGGSGSRLRCDVPKGCFQVGSKSLFQHLAEKIKKKTSKSLEVAIMTSPLNHEQTLSFFEENHYFGLSRDCISFFMQQMWPLLDLEGKRFPEESDTTAFGPSGNGDLFACLAKTEIWQKWKKKNIALVTVVPIDNILADPFEEELIGFHLCERNDISLIGAARKDQTEKVGVLTTQNGKIKVVEYTEPVVGDGLIANLGLYCFSVNFIEKVKDAELPIHKVKKATKVKGVIPSEPNCWKLERYIFDLFEFSDQTKVILYPREEVFAPLKSQEDILKIERSRRIS